MKDQTMFESVLRFSNKTTFRSEVIVRFCKRTPFVIFGIYAVFLFFLAVLQSPKLVLFIAVPAIDFIFITILRNLFNYKRPFETLEFQPLIHHSLGKSFPSRHTASAFIIGMACLYVNVPFGIFVLVLAMVVGITRVLVGVHYPKDVLVGAGISIALGVLGFFVLGHFIFTNPTFLG